jgi:hypothetical protein
VGDDRVRGDPQLVIGGRLQLNYQVGDPARDREVLPQIALLATLDRQVEEAADVASFLLGHVDLTRSNATCSRMPARAAHR